MQLAEGVVGQAIRRITAELPAELGWLGRGARPLGGPGSEPVGRPRPWVGEAILSREASRPFFITDYPKGARGFYDKESPERPGFLRNFDLIAPEGYGELCSGSERENDYGTIIARIRETGENPAKYGWYLQILRDGIPGSAGFGIGVERLTRYIAGLHSVWQASAYPKVPGVASH